VKPSRLATALRITLSIGLVTGALAPTDARANCAACSCSVSTTNLNFGTYNPTSSTPTNASGNVSVNCFSLLVLMFGTVDVTVSAGSSGVAASRKMANGTSQLSYNIYRDAALTSLLGTAGSGQGISLSINGLLSYTTSHAVYGSIPARQWVKAGTYSDSLVVTVSY